MAALRRLPDGAAGEWDEILLSLPAPHVLQSAAWADIKSRWGWRPHRLAWGPAGAEWAAAQVLVREVAGRGLRLAYVPRGPLLRRPDEEGCWAEVLRDLRRWCRERGVATVKIDAGLSRDRHEVAAEWARQGWRPVVREIQFPNTMISDLRLGADGLLATMKPKTRYNIRLAERRGVVVRAGDERDLGTFFQLYRATAARGRFAARTWPYYADAWTTLLGTGRAALLLAERDGSALAGSLSVAFGSTAWYLYGASGDEGRDHMPSYLAQWESLLWAMSVGCLTYDWWGAPTRPDERDPMWGVGQFKRGFGARLVEQYGAWETGALPFRHQVLVLAERLRSSWLSARAARAGGGGGGAATL